MSSPKEGRPRAFERPPTDGAVECAVAAFRAGRDRDESFRLLVERFYRPVLSFFSRRVSSPQDRLDLAQETFLCAYRGLDGFRGESRFSTWLFRIAHHTYLGWVRREAGGREEPLENRLDRTGSRGPQAVASYGERIAAPPRPDAALLARERRSRLRAAIDDLPAQMRRCMALRVVHELSYQEIADVLRISIGTVKAHLFKGRERLAADLREEFDELET